MTVSSGYAPNSSIGNGVTTVFPYNFRILAAADLEVTLDGVVKALGVDYTLSGVGSGTGGNVTFTAAPANGVEVIRRRNMALVRTTDYQDNGDLLADVLNPDQDSAVLMIQQVQEQVNRSLKFPLGDATDPSLLSAEDRAGKVILFDDNGDMVLSETVGGSIAAAAASAAAAAHSADEAADSMAEADVALAQAVIARDSAQAARNNLSPLAYDYDTAFLIDATSDSTDAAYIAKAGQTVTQQSLHDAIAWGAAAMITHSDGSVRWSPHNFQYPAKNLSHANFVTTGCTKGPGAAGPRHLADAMTLTASASPAYVSFTAVGLHLSAVPGYFGAAYKVKYTSARRFVYIRLETTGSKFAYFDLQSAAVGTVDAGVTAAISRYDADGVLLDDDWFMISAAQFMDAATSAAGFFVHLGFSNADASPVVTATTALTYSEPQLYRGIKPVTFVGSATVATPRYGAPYTWENGSRELMLWGGATYTSLYSDDLTNAAWAKTNCTPLLNATGIHGQPCSTLTATGANATCLQAVTSAGANQTFACYIRRKTGAGAISITTDNGGTYTDITAQLNSSTYKRFYLHGAANPGIGFKIATSGDAIEVCLAVNVSAKYLPPPASTLGASVALASISFSALTIPVTLGGTVLAYCDMRLPNDTNLAPGIPYTGVTLSSSASGSMLLQTGRDWFLQDGSGSTSYPVYDANGGNRIETTAYLSASGNYCSVNGEPLAADYRKVVTGLDQYSMSGNGSIGVFVRKLLITPSAIALRDDLRTLHYSQGIRNSLYAASLVCADREVSGTTMNREAAVFVLSDNSRSALMAVVWMQKNTTGFGTEEPARLMQRNYCYDKATNTLTPVTNTAILFQNSRWASGLGHSQSPVMIRVPSGTNKGRLILLFANLDSVSGTHSDEDINIYKMTNDADGDPTAWSVATKVIDASNLGYTGIVHSPGGDYIVLPADHPTAPGRIVTITYTNTARVISMYSDDNGANWTLGTPFLNASPTLSEPTITYWPDGTVIATMRTNSGSPDERYWAKSTDGGVTFTVQGNIPSINCVDVSGSTAQLDPTGALGANGKIALSTSTEAGRSALQIGFATTATMQLLTSIAPVNSVRYFGYSSLKSLFGGEYLALATEGGRASGNLDNSAYLLIVKP